MKQIEYIIQSPVGIHARPAGMLVNTAGKFSSEITVSTGGRQASARKLFALMKLGAKQNDTIRICANGPDEDEAIQAVSGILSQYF